MHKGVFTSYSSTSRFFHTPARVKACVKEKKKIFPIMFSVLDTAYFCDQIWGGSPHTPSCFPTCTD